MNDILKARKRKEYKNRNLKKASISNTFCLYCNTKIQMVENIVIVVVRISIFMI